MPRLLRLTFGILLAPLLAGCAEQPKVIYSAAELRDELQRRLGAEKGRSIVVPFEVDRALAERAQRFAFGVRTPQAQLEVLAVALTSPDAFGIEYDDSLTLTARETLARKRGDCLSLTGLFVGLARAIDLEVYFVDARGIQQFSSEGNLYVDRRHIVAGWGHPPQFTVIDFDRVMSPHVQYRILTDIQALARYHNNLGFDELRSDRNAEAAEQFRTALKLDPAFAAAHNNLAVALARRNALAEAEEHLVTALGLDPFYSAAMINLANLYDRTGRGPEAAKLRRDAGAMKLRDPMWRLEAGLEAFRVKDYERAIRELEAAVDLDDRIVIAWLRLAQSFEASGNRRKALHAVDHVLRVNPDLEEAKQIKARLTDKPS